MEWPLILLVIFASLVALMATGMPIALCFALINIAGALLIFGGPAGLDQYVLSIHGSLVSFLLLPLPLFILMGELMFQSGIVRLVIDTVDKWIGRLPGRLGLLAVTAGVVFAALSGVSMANVALLGSTLVPEMEKRGYKRPMSLGPILASGGLAIMIPPTAFGVLLGVLGNISIAKILIAIIIPGLLIGVLYCIYIVGRCQLQPSIAPPYDVKGVPLSEKLLDTARYVLPLGLVVFLVIGVIMLGIATPSEAAATGAMGAFALLLLYRRLAWAVVKSSIIGTIRITGMMFLIISGATAFSQLLAFSGAARGLVELSKGLPLPAIGLIAVMMGIVLLLGSFLDGLAIMMITLPIFMPVVLALGFDPVWFAVMYLLNVETGTITPPFGTSLFVMKGVASRGTTMGEIYQAGLPFVALNVVAIALIMAFPPISLWLPGLIR